MAAAGPPVWLLSEEMWSLALGSRRGAWHILMEACRRKSCFCFFLPSLMKLTLCVTPGILAPADITTKDLHIHRNLPHSIARNPPCLPGQRNPCALLRAWHGICCAPVRMRNMSSYPVVPASP